MFIIPFVRIPNAFTWLRSKHFVQTFFEKKGQQLLILLLRSARKTKIEISRPVLFFCCSLKSLARNESIENGIKETRLTDIFLSFGSKSIIWQGRAKEIQTSLDFLILVQQSHTHTHTKKFEILDSGGHLKMIYS